jgi:undecaprenyl diphosphate synthase
LSYAELYFTDVFWPDFNAEQLKKAISSFYQRQRRFGGDGEAAEGGKANSDYEKLA